MNDKELDIYNNPHPKSLQRNADGGWDAMNLYCYSIYMYYFDYLVKHGYENCRTSRNLFIESFGFNDDCREYLLKSNYSDYLHRTLYSVLFEFMVQNRSTSTTEGE